MGVEPVIVPGFVPEHIGSAYDATTFIRFGVPPQGSPYAPLNVGTLPVVTPKITLLTSVILVSAWQAPNT